MPNAVHTRKARAIPGLDGLRGLSVILVVLAHIQLFARTKHFLQVHGSPAMGAFFDIDPGDLGVSVFFVISGYLITTLLIRNRPPTEKGSLKTFYLRRFFRIFPPYYFYLAVVGILWFFKRVSMSRGGFVSSLAYVSNYYPYVWSHPESLTWAVGHTWSLSLEEQFYLFWPACIRFLGQRRSAVIGVTLLALAPILRVLTGHFVPQVMFDGQIFRMFHTRIDTIMAGCLLALLANHRVYHERLLVWARSGWLALLAAVLLYASLLADDQSVRYHMRLGVSVEALLLTFLVYYSVVNVTGLWGGLLDLRPLRHLGVISYGVYLWQQLFVGSDAHLLGRYKIFFPVAILLSAEFSYWTVERGSYALRDWVLRSQARPLARATEQA